MKTRSKTSHILQRDLFTPPEPVLNVQESRLRRDAGIEQAEKSANTNSVDWVERAYRLFVKWLEAKPSGFLFMMEDARGDLPIEPPPSNRAYGGVMLRAAKNNLVVKVGLCQVKNVKAHRCFATQWMKN